MDLKVNEQQGAVIDDAELGYTQDAEAEFRGAAFPSWSLETRMQISESLAQLHSN